MEDNERRLNCGSAVIALAATRAGRAPNEAIGNEITSDNKKSR